MPVTLNQRFSVVALLLLGLTAQAKTDALLLESIAHVESGITARPSARPVNAVCIRSGTMLGRTPRNA